MHFADLRHVLAIAIIPAVILFGAAGRVDLPRFWAWLAVPVAAVTIMFFIIDRGLLEERLRPRPGGVDRGFRYLNLAAGLTHMVIAGLDVGRWHFSDTIPQWLGWIGFALLLLMMIPSLSAVRVNHFFSPVVRVQDERGHQVVTRGPYAFVRHPAYASWLIGMPGGGLLLGSWLALAVLLVPVVFTLRRTAIEDAYLQQNLPGYRDYAATVRYRLLPGVW
ncbi:MAG: methyltransferase family protein [Phycisphaerae bacterium]